jgi:hypothetical protein
MDPVDLATFSVIAELHSGIDASRLARMDRVVQLASSALAAPLAGYGEVELYPSLADKAAIYASRIMRNHPLPGVVSRRLGPAGRRETDLQREDQFERRVDRALLIKREPACVSVEAIQVHGAQLLDQHACRFAVDLDLRAECGGRRASRGRRDDRGREPEELVGLHDHRVSWPSLLMPSDGGQAEAKDVAARHSGQSAEAASMSAITARRSFVSAGSSARRRTSSASSERRRRRRPASTSAMRTASDSLRPSRINIANPSSEESSRRARTTREAMRRM